MIGMSCTAYVGTSGYSYADWVGPVYPQGTDRNRFLELYARRFGVVELNFSYYRQPSASVVSKMIDRTPDGFRFSVKAHKSLTHLVTDDWKRDAAVFSEGIAPLAESGRLIAVLLQFPYSFHYSPENRTFLARLCDRLSRDPLAVEFRNPRWHTDRVVEGLRERSVCYVMTDYPKLEDLPDIRVETTTDFAYLRFHGRNGENWWTGDATSRYDYRYSDAEIDEWVDRIGRITTDIRLLVAMFNNHWRGHAAENATMFKKKLETLGAVECADPSAPN